MKDKFAATLCSLRTQNGLTQQQLADKLFIDRSTLSHWENGRRIPDPVLLSRIAAFFDIDISVLLDAASDDAVPNVVVVDDEKILLRGMILTLTEALPNAEITGFSTGFEVIDYTRHNHVSILFLDIELGKASGINLCNEILKTDPLVNIIFITAYPEHSLKAWNTAACGFLVKPLTVKSVRDILTRLRHPVRALLQGGMQ